MEVFIYCLIAVCAASAVFAAVFCIRKRTLAKKAEQKRIKDEETVAAIIAAVAIFTERPASDFRVISFKKTNKFKAWNSR